MEQVDHVGDYYTVAGAARKLGYDYYQIADLLRQRKDIPRVRLGHRMLLVRVQDVHFGLLHKRGE